MAVQPDSTTPFHRLLLTRITAALSLAVVGRVRVPPVVVGATGEGVGDDNSLVSFYACVDLVATRTVVMGSIQVSACDEGNLGQVLDREINHSHTQNWKNNYQFRSPTVISDVTRFLIGHSYSPIQPLQLVCQLVISQSFAATHDSTVKQFFVK